MASDKMQVAVVFWQPALPVYHAFGRQAVPLGMQAGFSYPPASRQVFNFGNE